MNRKALIIGGSSGIGLATVKKLAQHQFDLYVIHRDTRQRMNGFKEAIGNVTQHSKTEIHSFNIDATNEEKIEQVVQDIANEFKHTFDLVVHSISRGNLKPFVSNGEPNLSSQDIMLTIQAMGTSLQLWTNSLLNHQLIGAGSQIVTLTSEGNNKHWKGYGAIALAKSTLETMANYLAVELASQGIRVNILQAGVTDTPSLRMIPEAEELIAASQKRNPMGRITTVEDVANAIYLLSLPEATWINGSTIHVDGGEHLI